MNSIATQELSFDPEIKTAILYSIAENSSFLVEVHYQANSYYLSLADDPIQYTSLTLAKKAAIRAGALQGYQALENIYQEIGISTEPGKTNPRYEYVPLELS